MDSYVCQVIQTLGPYVLVALFAIFFVRLVKRHREHVTQLHTRTLDAFERQNAFFERVHFDLIELKRHEPKDVAPTLEVHPKKR